MSEKNTCPICNNTQTHISTKYRKAPILRILKFSHIILAFIFFTALCYHSFLKEEAVTKTNYVISSQQPQRFIVVIICLALSILFYILQIYKEQKILTVYTCKECGETWIAKN